MKRILLKIAYDGTAYCGWQVQKNGLSVQEVIDRELSKITGERVRTIGASRTDAGVHALGNIAVFDTEARMPGEKYSYALNAGLPEDIRIQGSQEVPPDFHPRYTNTVKTYEYRILNREFPDPLWRNYSLFDYSCLDIDAMRKAAEAFEGRHDFAGFQASGASSRGDGSTVRTVYSAGLSCENEKGRYKGLIVFRITGSGFLYNMVRIIAGTLLDVGRGRTDPDSVEQIISLCNRKYAGPTAPAHGLTLVSISYPEWKEISV